MVKVGVHEFYPMVYREADKWTGFEVELWEEIARRAGIEFELIEEPNLHNLINKAELGQFDLVFAGITRTPERAERLRMSYLTMGTGLIVGVKAHRNLSLLELGKRLVSPAVMRVLTLVAGFAFVVAHAYWFLERGHSVAESYLQGVYESLWWAFVTFSTVGYGDIYPVTTAGKFFGIFAILLGLAIFGLFIAQLTASLTEQRLRSAIRDVNDIAGKTVATKTGTTAIRAIRAHGGHVKEFPTVNVAAEAMLSGQSDAVISDAPTLQGIKDMPELHLVGGLFAHQSYAFATPKESDLIDAVNHHLIAIRSDETFDRIYNTYFE